MDKEKMNLEQLYNERFQSFEMDQANDINLRMKQKIRHAKSMQMIKWIAIGLLITASVVIISLLGLKKDGLAVELAPHKTQMENALINEASDSQTPVSSRTETKQLVNSEAQTLEKEAHEKTPLQDQPLDEDHKNLMEIEEAKESINAADKSFIASNINTETNVILVDELDEKEARNTMEISFLESRSSGLILPLDINGLEEKEVNVYSKENHYEKSGRKKSKTNDFNNNPPTLGNSTLFSGYLDVHFSPILWNNQANMAMPEMDTSWSYSSNQKAQLSYETGISFQLHHQKTPLFLQIGLDYQVLKEKIDFLSIHSYEDSLLSHWTYDSTFDIQEVIDTFFVTIDSNHFVIDTLFTQDTLLSGIDSAYNSVVSTEEEKKNYVNTYTYLNIPLMLGYEFETRNERWSFQLLAGAAMAINLSNEGYYYTKNGDFIAYSGKVKPSLVWNLQAAANINYRYKKWQFFLQPEFQYQLNESEIQSQPPRRKYQFYKLKAGIRFKLF